MLFDIIKIVFIIIIYLVIQTLISLTYIKQHVIDNWGEYKCKPVYMATAGFFGYDTTKNFQECILSNTTKNASLSINPVLNISNLIGDVLGDMGGSLNSLRFGLSEIQGFFGNILGSLTDRITNMITSIQMMTIKTKDLMAKLVGVFATLIYTLMTSIATMNSMVAGPIGELAGVACFHPNTMIKLSNGYYQLISNIRLGEELSVGGQVISLMKFKNNSPLYKYQNILVSGDHLVLNNNEWIRVEELEGISLAEDTQIVYCLSSQRNKIITFNGNLEEGTFSDYIETSNHVLNCYIKDCVLKFLNGHFYPQDNMVSKFQKQFEEAAYNNYYIFGFHENTLIKLQNGNCKKISDLQIGDITHNHEQINGTIQHLNLDKHLYNLDGILVSGEQIVYHQDSYKLVKNILGLEIIEDHEYVYQVSTNTGSLKIGNNIFRDHHESKDKKLNAYIDNLVVKYLNKSYSRKVSLNLS